MLDGDCVENCGEDLYADNYSMTCKKMSENPVYIKAYTFSRCINSCGKQFKDCSCREECRKLGNCCSDFRFCEIIFDNHINSDEKGCIFSTTDKKVCLQCKDNFYYYNGRCINSCPIGTIIHEENNLCIDANSN
jgi:hypothetical protein